MWGPENLCRRLRVGNPKRVDRQVPRFRPENAGVDQFNEHDGMGGILAEIRQLSGLITCPCCAAPPRPHSSSARGRFCSRWDKQTL